MASQCGFNLLFQILINDMQHLSCLLDTYIFFRMFILPIHILIGLFVFTGFGFRYSGNKSLPHIICVNNFFQSVVLSVHSLNSFFHSVKAFVLMTFHFY